MTMELQLRRIMQEKGIDGQQLADRMGVTKQYISNTIRGGSASIRMYEKMADALGVPLWMLFAPAPEPKEEAKPEMPDLTLIDHATGETRQYKLIQPPTIDEERTDE